MKLDRSTYEAWLLDRIEGSLSPDQVRELDAFLAANPELGAGLDELPAVSCVADAIAWKDELKKHFPPQGFPDAARLNDFLVARLEHELTPAQEQALDRFLYEHPWAKRDAELMARSKADASLITFNAKPSIQRNFPPLGLPDQQRLTDFLIAEAEGDLSPDQRSALSEFIQADPDAQRAARLVKLARVGIERIDFANKEQLKKREARVIPLWPRLAAAASIALVAGAAWWLLREQQVEPVSVAAQKEETAPSAPEVRSVPEKNEAPVAAVVSNERKEQASTATRPIRSVPATPSVGRKEPETLPQPQLPVPQEPTQRPQLAQENNTRPSTAEQPAVAQIDINAPTLAGPSNAERPAHQGSTTISTLLANTVREGVLDAPQRNAGLDGDDAVAAVDKGLSTITGGAVHVEVKRTPVRERLHLRLGQGFSLTASRGR